MKLIKPGNHFQKYASIVSNFASGSLFILFCIFALGSFASAQSGRIKTPTPTPTPRPRRIYVPPSEKNSKVVIPKPTPTPTPKTDDDGGETLQIDSFLVPIPVSVFNAKGQAVTNLTLADFELMIDGKKVEIGDLARSETPVRIAMLFDNSGSVSEAREFETNAAIQFFRRVIRPEKDLVALFSVAAFTRLEQPLTKDVSALVRAIESFAEPQGGTQLLEGIIKAANYLKDVQGRRIIVIVSDGEDNLSDVSLEETVKALQLANCQVYVIKTTDFENYKRTGKRGGNANIRYLAAERRMQDIVAQTGGTVYSPLAEDELNEAFIQISAELSEQYILSYYPEDEKDKRGEFRTISLNVKNRQNLTIRTRKGYYVPKKL